MALLPYASRVTQQRGGRGGERGDRAIRADGPPPRPTSPPPSGAEGDELLGDEFVTEELGDEVFEEAEA
jgi:hypothetical protein